ncbi:MAG: DUF72 domain-containing protein [Candidatus Bathyarchaeia archaeon]
MTDYLVGTGGWGYFNVANKPRLKTYSEIFNFVEVNNTFYQYPLIQTVERWRRTVPKDFTFSVRCHQDLTHKIGLRPTDEAYEVFYKMKQYTEILQTPYLVLETPAGYVIDSETRGFFSSLNLKGITLAWEYRATITPSVIQLMQDFNIVQSVDLSKQMSRYKLDVTYSRLFGRGEHNIYQFTDDELLGIQQRTEETGSKTLILAFHGLRMNSDALRFQQHLATGKFLPATSSVGIESAKTVLAEDATFPSSKSELIKKQGWKVIDVKQNKTAHLSEFLSSIPDKNYADLNEVVKELGVYFERR